MSVIIREIQTKNILTKSDLPVGDRSLNPYVGCEHACKYCYACFMNRFTGHTEPWGTYVDVKMWKPLLHTERYAGEEIFLGSVTDPYQPCEERYRRTRAALEELAGSGAKISIATKSDLVMRDMDILKRFSDARVSWSINTLDEDLKNDMDNAVCQTGITRTGLGAILFGAFAQPNLANMYTIACVPPVQHHPKISCSEVRAVPRQPIFG